MTSIRKGLTFRRTTPLGETTIEYRVTKRQGREVFVDRQVVAGRGSRKTENVRLNLATVEKIYERRDGS